MCIFYEGHCSVLFEVAQMSGYILSWELDFSVHEWMQPPPQSVIKEAAAHIGHFDASTYNIPIFLYI